MRDGLHRVRDGGCPNNATTRRRDGATTRRALKRASRPRRARLCTAAHSQREAAAARMAGVCEHKPVHLGTVAAHAVPQPARQPRAVAAHRRQQDNSRWAVAAAAELAAPRQPERRRAAAADAGDARGGAHARAARAGRRGLPGHGGRGGGPAQRQAALAGLAPPSWCSCARGCSSIMCVWTHFALKRGDSGRRCPDRARDWSSLIA